LVQHTKLKPRLTELVQNKRRRKPRGNPEWATQRHWFRSDTRQNKDKQTKKHNAEN
jgi:hypothetical protein